MEELPVVRGLVRVCLAFTGHDLLEAHLCIIYAQPSGTPVKVNVVLAPDCDARAAESVEVVKLKGKGQSAGRATPC